jgi:glucosamine--fructose-6-phosphate aminotransferase (isomerizing)|tara:strand:+ start:15765 stop:17591 length:1827 start_codon:yes stop_codon:yes gene_type:complete
MCGIVGILGKNEVSPLILESLKRLEYRGYDSAGIATVNLGKLDRRRSVGKLLNLSDHLVSNPLSGKSGIGHTRWATHGAPTIVNSHPHQSGTSVAVVHNGIIENFNDLKSKLIAEGANFESETDTEVIAHLVHKFMKSGMHPTEAVKETLPLLQGAFALCFLFSEEPDLMIAARQGSPLAIGYGNDEMFIGSDAIALSPLTNKISYLEEGDCAVIQRNSVKIFDQSDNLVERKINKIKPDQTRSSKDGFKHFMLKEIFEQPEALSRVITKYISADGKSITIKCSEMDLDKIKKITMVACGTAYLACATAKYWFEKFSRIPVEVDIASEFRYREPPLTKDTLAIFVSQSGETADTLAALRYAKIHAKKVISIVNVSESSIARESDLAIPILAGPEISVASTKGFTNQLAVLAILALKIATEQNQLSSPQLQTYLANLRYLPSLQNNVLDASPKIEKISRKLSKITNMLFLGRGVMHPLALEGALKLKEISYIHAEGFASGELKHGPIALIDNKVPVVVIAPTNNLFEKTISNMHEVMARDGKVILVTDCEGSKVASEGSWEIIEMPKITHLFAPIVYAIPMQLLAYYTAVTKGTDVDQPRNLAKSVTVE